MGYFLWFRSWPDEYELPTEYTVKNVKIGEVYLINSGNQVQSFEILNIRGSEFFFEVYPSADSGGMYPQHVRIRRWVTRLPSDRLITGEDLIATPGDDEAKGLIPT
ncbi:MAG: hypothetical protein WBB68_03810 [Candidatus Moraniibacteriota bacterium]